MTDPRHEERHEDGLGGIVRKVFSPGPTPEERLERLLADRRRELEETAARFDASIADLERREDLLRDSRASVERMLRLGQSDLEARETELTDFLRELTDRETRVAEADAELARRRQELGAVELKRAAVDRRERDVAAQEERLAVLEEQLADRAAAATHSTGPAQDVELAFAPGPAYRLVEIAAQPATPGATIAVEGEELVVTRVGPSPLPGDSRRCAYLTRTATARPSDAPAPPSL